MKKWDVVLLSYPFTDLSATKVRPALVISPDAYNQHGQDAVFVLITTNTNRQSAFDVVVTRAHPDFGTTGLRFDSAIRVDKIFTLRQTLVQRTLGSAGAQLKGEMEKQLRVFLELPGNQLPLNL